MIFFGITLLIALAIAFIGYTWKRGPFEPGKFAARTVIAWFIVMAIAVLLFVIWVVVAFSSLGGSCFNC